MTLRRARLLVRTLFALAALIAALAASSARAQDETYDSLDGAWWFALGGKDAGALLIELGEAGFATFAVEDVELTGYPSFGFSRALGGFFVIAPGQTLALDSRGHLVGTLELRDPDTDEPIGELRLESGKPSESRARLRSRGSIVPAGGLPIRARLVGGRAPASFEVLSGEGDRARLGGRSVSSRVYSLRVETDAERGLPAYVLEGSGPARVDRIEVPSVPLFGRFMRAPGGRIFGLADDLSHFGPGTLTGRLRLPTGRTVPKLDLRIEADRRIRSRAILDEAVEPVLSVSPTSHAFGAVSLLEDPPPPQTFLIENVGIGLLFGEASIAAGGSSAFTVLDPASYSYLAPGEEPFVILVQFDPNTLGEHSAELLLTTSSAAGARRVALSGTGGAPILAVDPVEYDFLSVDVGGSEVAPFTISNDGDAVLSGSATLSGSASFALLPASGDPSAGPVQYTIEPGATAVVRVRFTPASAAAHATTLSLSGGRAVVTVSVSGSGTTPE